MQKNSPSDASTGWQIHRTGGKVLDIALILHAEHGGGNNSTFTTHVVTSSGTDTYSSIAASIGSLKGPRHGGANLKVQNMFEDIEANVKDWTDEKEVEAYLRKILNKEAFDHTGLIYGMGHAVYTLSDPREVILKRFCQRPCTGEGNDERICPLRTGRTSGRKNGHGTAETFQKCLRKRRLLQWFRIYYAWNPQKSCFLQFSQLHVFRDGAHIVLRKSSMRATRLSVRHINMWDIMQTSFRLKKESRRKAAKKYCGISKRNPQNSRKNRQKL